MTGAPYSPMPTALPSSVLNPRRPNRARKPSTSGGDLGIQLPGRRAACGRLLRHTSKLRVAALGHAPCRTFRQNLTGRTRIWGCPWDLQRCVISLFFRIVTIHDSLCKRKIVNCPIAHIVPLLMQRLITNRHGGLVPSLCRNRSGWPWPRLTILIDNQRLGPRRQNLQ
jgi:hypothetical protein